jgi:phosphoglycerate dehydrogenase-like enzyme
MQVLLYERSFGRVRAWLEQNVPQLEPLRMQDDGSLLLHDKAIAAADVAPAAAWASTDLYTGGPVRDFMVACLRSTSLRWLQSSAAGFDHPVFSMLVDKGVALSNSHASSIAIAEFVLAAVLDEYQPQRLRRSLQHEKRWQRTAFREIAGTVWLVYGVGNIGTEIARRARAFGASVIGVRRTPRGDEPVDRMIRPELVHDALPACDVVVLAAPANRESERFVSTDFLVRMKSDAILINIARGTLVDETALLASLERGTPACAILDVFGEEPLPETSPLWAHPRVRVTAHAAAHSDGFARRSDETFLTNLKRFVAGELPDVVDPAIVKQSVPGQRV